MPQLLSDAVQSSHREAGGPVDRIRWVECFTGKERHSEFCEATDPAGNFESNSSSGHREYQDRLRAIALRCEGQEKAEIAQTLGRSAKFVQTWWRKDPKEVPRPPGVHEYLKPEFWRDIEVVRGFGKGLGVYDELMATEEWVQPNVNKPSFKGGGYFLKYDKEGRTKPQGNQVAKDGLLPGRHAALDRLSQRLLAEKGIDDRVLKRPGILWYPDGEADAVEHRHEAWTALMSFGKPRILTIDKHPILLRDGDLILFGTQRHGVPKMCDEDCRSFDDYGGRISVVFFFMPTGQQAKGAEPWKAITDDNAVPSRKAAAMLRDADLGAGAALQGLSTGAKAQEVAALVALGFGEQQAGRALAACGLDVEQAAELLLGGGLPDDDLEDLGSRRLLLQERLEELARRRSRQGQEDDGAFAARLQQESDSLEWEEEAILQQLQELEREEALESGPSEALRSQFATYEEMLDEQEADQWDGRGDLMVRHWRQARLQIEQQEAATVYACGCGGLQEQVFFELLSMHSVRVLYDFRADPTAAPQGHFQVRSLELACKARGLLYRHIALGREGAYGILKHLREDEGRHALAELVWQARRKRAAFLGAEEDWRLCQRFAVAERLQGAGHKVVHVLPGGGLEEHPEGLAMPEHLASEESRLRELERQRQSGEARRPVKSAASRSTEHVALRLTQPRKEVDVGAELRKAKNQTELVQVQRRMAALQRRAEDEADFAAGLGPRLLHVNKWVRAEAQEQRENLAAGKTMSGQEKGKARSTGSSSGSALEAPTPSASSACPAVQESCSSVLPMAALEEVPEEAAAAAAVQEEAARPSWRARRRQQREEAA